MRTLLEGLTCPVRTGYPSRTCLIPSETIKIRKLTMIKLIPIGAVCAATSLARATLYRMMARDDFPKPCKLSERRVAWPEDVITDWIRQRTPKFVEQ